MKKLSKKILITGGAGYIGKNFVNFPIGYDIINANLGDPYVKKFSTKSGVTYLENIYKNKRSKLFIFEI